MYLRVGLIGTGNISQIYLTNSPLLKGLKYVACSDLRDNVAESQAKKYGLRHDSVERLLNASDIDVVLNLTIPTAHYEVSLSAIRSGKHVYSEKPLSTLLEDGRKLLAAAVQIPSLTQTLQRLKHGYIRIAFSGISVNLSRGAS